MEDFKLNKNDYEKLAALDNINEVIKQMSCSDPKIASKAFHEADELVKQLNNSTNASKKTDDHIVVDKTFINKSPDLKGNGPQCMSVDSFKAQVAADASERSRLRAERRAKAEHFKSQANEFFKVGDWKTAIVMYTKAIDSCRDWSILYTNRAQACLKAGQPEQALADCDVALRLLPMEPWTTPTNVGDEANAARVENQLAAKACLHRGKALLSLHRPQEALSAYMDARAFRTFAVNPAIGVLPKPECQQWPEFLREYVEQARAAITAENLDNEVSSDLSEESNSSLSKPTKEKFLKLIAKAAVGRLEIRQHTTTLRQMVTLLSAASQPINVNHISNNSDATRVGDKTWLDAQPLTNGRKPQKNCGVKEVAVIDKTASTKPLDTSVARVNGDGTNEVATLAMLQSYFRIKNGFKVLEAQIKRFNDPNLLKLFRFPDAVAVNVSSPSPAQSAEEVLAVLNYLLTFVTVCYHVARDCGENQRLLVETMPELFSTFLVECLQISPLNADLSFLPTENRAVLELRFRHVLSLLQLSACDLVALMSGDASGREGLLTHPGPASLLSALSLCLSDALGLPPPLPDKTEPAESGLGLRLPKKSPGAQQAHPVSSGFFAAQTSSATAKILENLAKSPRFSLLVRSTDCFTSLQNVVEAAVAPSPGGGSTPTMAPVDCLSTLLDSLSAASDDPALRRTMVSKANFLLNLVKCAIRHVPLTIHENHNTLVCSLCRLLHNFLTGERPNPISRKEMEALLDLSGSILDQPPHCSTLISVAIALLGKFLPLCYVDLIEKWTHSGKDAPENLSTKKNNANSVKLKERISILISIISFCSASVLYESPQQQQPNKTSYSHTRLYESSETLAGHRLRGSIRALSAITKAPCNADVRMAIGDNRLVTRRLAQLVRVRVSASSAADSKDLPRDEPLAANVCLIFESCIEDTIMAELLVGSSIVMDLLKLIQDSKRPETKRNAAVVIGRLATASHVHREEVSRLGGMSVLSRFNSWARGIGASSNSYGLDMLF